MELELRGSKHLSALLLLGPLLPGGLAVTPAGRVPSLPHVAMTVAALRERGIAAHRQAGGPDAPNRPALRYGEGSADPLPDQREEERGF